MGDIQGMSTQLRLVEAPKAPADGATRRARAKAATGKAGAQGRTPRRAVKWSADWRLDTPTRQAGRQGVAQARAALAQARRPEPRLKQAS